MATPVSDNLLGALALLVYDNVDAQLSRASGLNATAQAALLCVDTYATCSIDQLRVALGLSHAAAVRCVAGLADAGWVDKTPGEDRRSVSLQLTLAGRAVQKRLLEARAGVLGAITSVLGEAERRELEALLRKLLWNATADEAQGMKLCRLCDCGPCLKCNCPVEARLQGAKP